MKNTLKAALLVSSALIATPVWAQSQPTPPEHYALDPRGVDMVRGTFHYTMKDLSIGPDGEGLQLVRSSINGGWNDNLSGYIDHISNNPPTYSVVIGSGSHNFKLVGNSYVPTTDTGSSLVKNGALFVFNGPDGSVAEFQSYPGAYSIYESSDLIKSLTLPNGYRQDYFYKTAPYCQTGGPVSQCSGATGLGVRLQGVVNNRGYLVKFSYLSDNADDTSKFIMRTKSVGINLAVEYCDAAADSCALSNSWPSASYVMATPFQPISSVDESGRSASYTYSANKLNAVRFGGNSINEFDVVYDPFHRVESVNGRSGQWNYTYQTSGPYFETVRSTGPDNQTWSVGTDARVGRPAYVSDALGSFNSFSYDGNKRLVAVHRPEGNRTEFVYDARGNIVTTRQVPKSGSGLPNITTSAVYSASCTNTVTCNLPTSTTDARGAVTDYTYDQTHGGVLTVTAPAPTAGAVRPQTRISYAAQTAYYRNSAGNVAAAPNSIVLPVSTSSCATNEAPACVGTLDEVRTTIQYGSAGVVNNLLPTVVTQGDGAGTLSASVSKTYMANGDVTSVDGPLPGPEDTIYYRYDAYRRPVGMIGPDPDGAGSLMRRAQRMTYDVVGRPTQVEAGAVNGISDGDWNGFVSLQQQLTAYDGYGRPVITALHGGGQVHAVNHVSYDAVGRQVCVTQRMNPAAFNNLPGSACDPSAQGAYGPDRIAKYAYDTANRLTSSISGYGTSSPITESVTYTSNSLPLTFKDGAGNVSTMVYDGFDRLSRLRYPDAAAGSGTSSTSDYEQYGYDAGSNVISFRNRAGETIGSGYDALNRKIAMGGSAIADRTLSYDNLNRLKGMNYTSGGASFSNTYDALGRVIVQGQGGVGNVSYGYDLAGRRTSMMWPDGFFVNYDYNLANELTGIRENGATNWSLAWYGYDNLGRRTAQGRANGAATAWGYDGASRLTSLSHDLAGTANDLTLTYSFNPVGQILTRTMSNPAYAYTPGTGNTAYANNGKNQVTNVNGNAVGYDGRQNIISIPGGGSYGYNGANELTSATVGGTNTSLSYDPGGRLYQVGPTRFLYDGQQAIGEYDQSGNLLKRYVPGLGLDNVVTAYEGATPLDRRYLLADERGSVVSITDGSANALTTNTYDEYGQPGSGNGGRFQYTGQMWLPQALLYHYRARAYAPQLGRFMQTDPIGYSDGANVYGYVGADPVNMVDPMGTQMRGYPCARPTYSYQSQGPNGESVLTLGFARDTCYVNTGNEFPGENGNGNNRSPFHPSNWPQIPSPFELFSNPCGDGMVGGQRVVCAVVPLDAFIGPGEISATARAIAGGHAWIKHGPKFVQLGVKTQAQLESLIAKIMRNGGNDFKMLSNGRSAWWDDASGTVVIRDPGRSDMGTAFPPAQGRDYFDGLR